MGRSGEKPRGGSHSGQERAEAVGAPPRGRCLSSSSNPATSGRQEAAAPVQQGRRPPPQPAPPPAFRSVLPSSARQHRVLQDGLRRPAHAGQCETPRQARTGPPDPTEYLPCPLGARPGRTDGSAAAHTRAAGGTCGRRRGGLVVGQNPSPRGSRGLAAPRKF